MSDEWHARMTSGETEVDDVCIEIEAEYDWGRDETTIDSLMIEGQIVTETDLPFHEEQAVREAIDRELLFVTH